MAEIGSLEFTIRAIDESSATISNVSRGLEEMAGTAKEAGDSLDKAFDISTLDQARAMLDKMRQGLKLSKDELLAMRKQNTGSGEANQLNALSTRIEAAEKKGDSAAVAQLEQQYNALAAQADIRRHLKDAIEEQLAAIEEETSAIDQEGQKITSLRQRYREVKEEQSAMLYAARMAGDETAEAAARATPRYKELEKELGIITDVMGDVGGAGRFLGSDTAGLDAFSNGLQGVSGALSAGIGAIGMFTKENEDLQKIMLKVQSIMSITMGLKQMDNLLNKDSAFQLVLMNKARQVGNVLIGKEAVMKGGATVATAAYTSAQLAATGATTGLMGAVRMLSAAIMNIPVIGWILAAITAIIALISKLSSAFESESEKAAKGLEQQKIAFDALKQNYEEFAAAREKAVKIAERNVELTKAEGKSVEELRKAEDQLLDARKRAHSTKVGYYGEEISKEAEYRQEIRRAQEELQRAQELQVEDKDANIEYHINGKKLEEDAEDAVEQLQKYLELMKDKLELVVSINAEGEDLDFETKKREAERKKEDQERAKAAADNARKRRETELRETRTTEDARMQLIADSLAKEIELAQIASRRKIEDLKNRLKTENDLTKKAREEINAQILLEEQALQDKMQALQIANHIKQIDRQSQMTSRALATRRPTNAAEEDELAREQARNKRASEQAKLLAEMEGNISEQRRKEIDEELDMLEREYQVTLADIAKKRDDEYKKMLSEYGNFTDRKRELDEQYARDVAVIDKKIEQARNEANEEEVAHLERTKQAIANTYNDALKDLGNTYIRGFLNKAFDSKASLGTIKKAIKAVSDLATESVPDEGILAEYGLTAEQWEQIKDKIKETKKELEDLAEQKQGDTLEKTIFGEDIVGKFKALKDAMEIDPNTGKIKDLGAALQAVAGIGQMAADAFGNLGDKFAEWGELTNNSKLKEYGEELKDLGTIAGSTASGLASGGIVGAIVGAATGVFDVLLNEAKEYEEIKAQQAEETKAALDSFTETIGSAISALKSFGDTLNSLDYGNLAQASQDLINALRTQSNQLQRDIANMAIIIANQFATGTAGAESFDEYFKKLADLGVDTSGEAFESFGIDTENAKRYQILNDILAGYKQLKDHLDDLLAQLEEMQKDPTTSVLDFFNKMQEIRRANLDLLRKQLVIMQAAGKDTTEIQNQIDSVVLEMEQATAQMIGAFAGTDIASVVSDWIKIFDEFGTSGQTAMEKINQSVDRMVANMLKQRLVVKKLQEDIDNIWAAADRDDNGKLTEDEMEDAINETRNAAQSAKQYYDQLQRTLKENGINLDETTGNSFSQAVKGVSEETASIIAGQMNAIRVHQIEIQDILRTNIANSVDAIASNTRHLAVLPEMNQRLGTLEQAVGNIYTQRIGGSL